MKQFKDAKDEKQKLHEIAFTGIEEIAKKSHASVEYFFQY